MSNYPTGCQTKYLPFSKQESKVLRLIDITGMKISKNLAAILFTLCILCSGVVAFAQDDRIPDLDSGNGLRDNRFDPSTDVLPESDVKSIKPTVIPRDTISLKPGVKKPDPKAKPEENSSVLSFNFLYYLIERFKLSDIVD